MNKYVKELSNEEFDTAIKEHLKAASCPYCQSGISLIIQMPLYGPEGAKIACMHCGYTTKVQSISEPIGSGKRFGTPRTFNGLCRGIFKAVQEWNKKCDEVTING